MNCEFGCFYFCSVLKFLILCTVNSVVDYKNNSIFSHNKTGEISYFTSSVLCLFASIYNIWFVFIAKSVIFYHFRSLSIVCRCFQVRVAWEHFSGVIKMKYYHINNLTHHRKKVSCSIWAESYAEWASSVRIERFDGKRTILTECIHSASLTVWEPNACIKEQNWRQWIRWEHTEVREPSAASNWDSFFEEVEMKESVIQWAPERVSFGYKLN